MSKERQFSGLSEAVIIVTIMFLTQITNIQGKPARMRESRDILEFFRKAGNAFRKAGESALKVLIPNVMKTTLIPGTTPQGQQATQPKGPRIPLNAISEDAPKPVIPNKRSSLAKYKRDTGDENVADFMLALLRKPFIKGKKSNKKLLSKLHLDRGKLPQTAEKERKIFGNSFTDVVCRKLC